MPDPRLKSSRETLVAVKLANGHEYKVELHKPGSNFDDRLTCKTTGQKLKGQERLEFFNAHYVASKGGKLKMFQKVKMPDGTDFIRRLCCRHGLNARRTKGR